MDPVPYAKLVLARQSNTCTGKKQWYVCTKRNFQGCCTTDPCTSGVCPDDHVGESGREDGRSSSSSSGMTTTCSQINQMMVMVTTAAPSVVTTKLGMSFILTLEEFSRPITCIYSLLLAMRLLIARAH